MLPRHSVVIPQGTATTRRVFCSGLVFLSVIAIAWFGHHQLSQAKEHVVTSQRNHSRPANVQPNVAASYGKLPLSFEVNQGQTDPRVRFLTRGNGYTIFLTDDGAVMTLKRASVVGGQLLEGARGAPKGIRPNLVGGLASVAQHSLFGAAAFHDRLSLSTPREKAENGVEKPRDQRAGPALPFSPSRLTDSSTSSEVLQMRLMGANAHATVTGVDALPGKSNYFIGNDPKKWRTNVPSYARVKYAVVYPGVDLIYYGNRAGQLEYDFMVAPGADRNQIKLSFAGADGMRVDAASGDLVLTVGTDHVRFRKPSIYQPTVAAVSDRRVQSPTNQSNGTGLAEHGRRSETAATAQLDGAFVLASNNQVTFRVAGYDPRQTLVIDPVLSYSTYLGGSSSDNGSGISVDSSGGIYIVGSTESLDFPLANPIKGNNTGNPFGPQITSFVSKLNAAGSALIYSTYLGGSTADWGTCIAVDAVGDAYAAGYTNSTDFPTANPIQAANRASPTGPTAFVAKLNSTGSALVYSTYLGGSNQDQALGIAVDPSLNAYVTGNTFSTDFPTSNAIQAVNHGSFNAFVSKLNPSGSAFVFSTYLGGSVADIGYGIAADSSGNSYVAGKTGSADFPTANALQPSCGGSCTWSNAFVAKFNTTGSTLLYSTFLGGSNGDAGYAIAIDSAGNAYVTGVTDSTDFPTVNPLQRSTGYYKVFVSKLNATGSALDYSTYLGGTGGDFGYGVAVDPFGSAYVTGDTRSTDFPTANPIQATCGDCSTAAYTGDAFVARLNPTGSALVFSTFLGGSNGDHGAAIAVDASGNAYVTGGTASDDFPTAHPLHGTLNGNSDVFVAKLSTAVVTLSSTSLTFGPQALASTSAPQTESVTNTGAASVTISTVSLGGTNASDFATSADTCSGATLSANGSCTVSVTFTPTANGDRSASLTFTDSSPDSPQMAVVTGTGGIPTPVAAAFPASLTFSNQNLGTTSGSQQVTLSNTGTGTLSITSIGTSDNFGQTSNCAAAVASKSSCTINVSFAPTANGLLAGSLSIADNAVDSPLTVALSGTGVDFSVNAAAGSSTVATVAPGSPATFVLSVAGVGGFNQSVSFTCAGAPSESNCTVSPSPVTPGISAMNITVSVATTASSVTSPHSRPLSPAPPVSRQLRVLGMLALVLAVMAWAFQRRHRLGLRRWQSAILFPALAGALLTLALAGCGGGGGGGGGPAPNPGTTAGTYTLTVTGTAGSGASALSHSVTLTLTVS